MLHVGVWCTLVVHQNCKENHSWRSGPFLDLRSPLGIAPAALPAPPASAPGTGTGGAEALDKTLGASRAAYERFADARGALLQRVSRRLLQSEAVDFRRLWTDRGVRGGPPGGLSLWRPVAPAGYAALGAGALAGLKQGCWHC